MPKVGARAPPPWHAATVCSMMGFATTPGFTQAERRGRELAWMPRTWVLIPGRCRVEEPSPRCIPVSSTPWASASAAAPGPGRRHDRPGDPVHGRRPPLLDVVLEHLPLVVGVLVNHISVVGRRD